MIHEPAEQDLLRGALSAPFPGYAQRVAAFYHMIEYHLGWRDEQLRPVEAESGKLIRPRLCLLACRLVGGDPAQALPLAAAIQLTHDFTLVHDDIQDRSDLRRGRATVWKLWGEEQAINVGDALFAMSHLALAQLVERGVPAERVLGLLRDFDLTVLGICEGQYLDLSFEDRLDLHEDDYLAMIERKTAALLAAALRLGALVAGGDAQAEALAEYGLALGMAFQIQDDILGIWGDPELTGKPFAADLYRCKKSLPVVYALAHAPGADQLLLREIYGRRQVEDAEAGKLLHILERAGARQYAESMATSFYQRAMQALQTLADFAGCDQAALEELRALATSLLGRVA